MPSKNKKKRIEPSFGGSRNHRQNNTSQVGVADRLSPSHSKPARPKKASGDRRKHNSRKSKTRKAGNKQRRGLLWFTGKAVYWCLVAGLWMGIGVGSIVGYYASKLPSSASWSVPERPPNAQIVSVNGSLIANRGTTGGASIRLSEMSPYIPMAVIAIEDRRYQYHFGFDPIGFTRAMIRNVMAGRLVQGGSTLTQQLAKNMFLKPERTLERKVQELVLAMWLESKYTKDEILEMYLNRVFFGSGAYGVDAASRRYFDKSAREVNLLEAATLAGLLKAPSRLSLARNPEGARERAKLVMAAMLREEYVTESEIARAKNQEAKKAKRFWSGSEHYVADQVMKELTTVMGELNQDVIIDTTIDLELQEYAEEIIRESLAKQGNDHNVRQGALVSMSPNGAIRALVGGKEYADSQFNRATDAKRQPGSSFKPFVYLAALEAGRTPQSERQDLPVKIGDWTPVNYDRKYRGPVTLNTALSSSLNTIAAQLVMEVGPHKVISTAKRLGITSKLEPNASISLGTSEVSLLELTSAYAPFANGGRAVESHFIRRVRDLDGNVLFERDNIPPTVVVRPREVGMINHMLSHVMKTGTGKRASLGKRPAAGKTGTTQNSRDGLFIGYTANYVTGIWYGNDDGQAMKRVTGGSLPAESWKQYMLHAHSTVPIKPLPGDYSSASNGNRLKPVAGLRRSLSEIDGVPRPTANVKKQKPKSIIDLIFGN